MRLGWMCALVAVGAQCAFAQAPQPQPVSFAQPSSAPVDKPYPGTLSLSVDATDTARRILWVQEKLPVAPGALTLLFPEWLPGTHSPTGRADRLAGLTITGNGQPISWRRDTSDVYAYHLDVPAGVNTLDIAFQFLTPTMSNQGRVTMSGEIVDLAWNDVLLYPAGTFARQITVAPTLKLPQGWTYGTALESDTAHDGAVSFKPVKLNTLVDSPVLAGRYGKQLDLDPNGRSRVTLDVFADSPELLAAKPDHIAAHRALVREADALFGARHYDHYDMLLWLSDRVEHEGLEHHRSSENGTVGDYFTDWDKNAAGRDLVAHEYTHSWNGKFRRPADLWTPNFNTPMGDSLLWVYEGQTQYWGLVLAARSGLLSREDARDAFALIAAAYSQTRPGHAWRPLQDTTNDPVAEQRRSQPWTSWQRAEDYYNEGLLIWLDADTLIREQSHGRKSLDDFARAFFGIEDGRWTTATYTFDDVVATLNAVQPYDWATFLRQRLDRTGQAPLDGVARGGYRLGFAETPTTYVKASELRGKLTDFTYSLGFSVRNEGAELSNVIWNSPAFKAGLTLGQRIVAVNGIAYDSERLKDAVKAGGPIDLLMKNGDYYKTVRIEAPGGIKYPRLERVADRPAVLDDILAPKRKNR